MIATYLTHSQDCDLMVKCPSNTFDVKQGEKYVLQQSNLNEYTLSTRQTELSSEKCISVHSRVCFAKFSIRLNLRMDKIIVLLYSEK